MFLSWYKLYPRTPLTQHLMTYLCPWSQLQLFTPSGRPLTAFKTPPGLAPACLSSFIPSLAPKTSIQTSFLYLENPKLAPISGPLHLLFLLSAIFFPYSRLTPWVYLDFSPSITSSERPLFSYPTSHLLCLSCFISLGACLILWDALIYFFPIPFHQRVRSKRSWASSVFGHPLSPSIRNRVWHKVGAP